MPSAVTTPRTLCEAFQSVAALEPDAIALRDLGGDVAITWRQYQDRVRSIAAGLAGLGIGRGDTVALMLTNRPEFHLCDTATLHLGGTPFSVYNTNPAQVLAYQFDNADNRVVICERQFLPVIREAVQQGGNVEHIVCVDGADGDALSLEQLEAAPAPEFDFEAAWRAVEPDDLLTLVYTSGTTGPPKGVELTHANFLENARILDDFGVRNQPNRMISYLPDAHAANRWFSHYAQLLHGGQITTVADPKGVLDALTQVRPTYFLGVPRVWVKIKSGLQAALADQSPIRRKLAEWAIGAGRARARAQSEARELHPLARLQYPAADRLVLAKVRQKLGLDEVVAAVSGAAPIPREVHEFILGLGIPLSEGWGMSECTAAVTVNPLHRIKIGTVGLPVPGARITLADDGEVLVRGPMVMRGYRKDPAKTAEAIDTDGWLHTGDIGELDPDGYLKIIDRKKELIINAAGKNMSPTNIENAVLANCPLVSSVVVIGEQRQYNTMLICLDPDAATAFAAQHGLPDDLATVAGHPELVAAVQTGIDAANATLSRVEQIKKFTVLPEVWLPGSAYLTPTGKLKRASIVAHYAQTIEAMY